jgi:cytochrome c peroxidase
MRNLGFLLAVLAVGGCAVDSDDVTEAEDSEPILVGSVTVPGAFATVSGIGRRLELPLGLKASELELPDGDRLDPSLAELGNLLFFDRRLSKNAAMSCATCHDPASGYSVKQFTRGVDGNVLRRTAPPTMNRLFGTDNTWSGMRTLEEQASAPITSAAEMGLTREQLLAIVAGNAGYAIRFDQLVADGVLSAPAISVANIERAIATFQRATLMTGDSRVDRYQAGDASALTADEQRGLRLFQTKARCVLCHSGSNFTDESFHHIVPVPSSDLGRQEVTGLASDFGKFKTPSLRNVVLRGPYFHNGDPISTTGMALSVETVVRRYNSGPPLGERNEDPLIVELGMSSSEQSSLARFLRALTGSIPVPAWVSSEGTAASSPRREDIFLSPDVFDVNDYAAANPDLEGMTPSELRSHWLEQGMVEGRSALRRFRVKEYINLYPSVHDAFESKANTYRLAIEHYLGEGRRRGLVGRYALAPGFFDVDGYRTLNGRETALLPYSDAIEQFLTRGVSEHRPSASAPQGYFMHSVGGVSHHSYADGSAYCTFANAAAQQASRGRDDNVGVPRLAYLPPNLRDGGACVTTMSPPTPTKPAPRLKTAIVGFSCRNESFNAVCAKTVSCPAGMSVRAIRAACNLEIGAIDQRVVDAMAWNQLAVRKASNHVSDGHCRAAGIDIAIGSNGLLPPTVNPDQISYSCSEHDENGGDCHILGQILCSE